MAARSVIAALVLLSCPLAAAADTGCASAVGHWRGTDGPDSASQLELTADGRFRYALSEGALDEGAAGRWSCDGAVARLFTDPPPRPPRFLVESMMQTGAAPLTIFIRAANGQGVAGVYFRIEFDEGAPIESYTQYDGWTGDPADHRTPRWIQLTEPIYDIRSERMPVPDGARLLRFRLEANDLGMVDFRGASVAVTGDQLTLRDARGERHYARVAR